MENRKKCDPQKRKPIREKRDYDEIRDNVKNKAIIAQSRIQKSNSRSEVDNDQNLYSSDDEDLDIVSQESLSVERSVNVTHNVEETIHRRQREPTPEVIVKPLTPVWTQKSTSKLTPKLTPKKFDIPTVCLTFVILFLTVVVYTNNYLNFTFLNDHFENQDSNVNSEDIVLNNVIQTLQSLSFKYKNQDKNLWSDAYTSISELIKKRDKPSIILLLGEKTDPIYCLSHLLGNISSNALNSGRLTLTPNEFEHDMGSVIEDLRVKIKNNKAVIIWDLLNINVEALKAFHNLCDRINPLVEEVIYIITVIADDISKETKPLQFIEKKLIRKLSGKIKADAIQPLITRITDGPILIVKPEPTIIDCPFTKT